MIRITKFLIGGGVGFSVNIVSLYFFTSILGWWYLLSSALAFIVSVAASFVLQKFWVFGDSSTESIHIQSSVFLILASVNLLANTIFMFAGVEVFSLHYLLAQVVSSGIVAIWSFWIYHLLFVSRRLIDGC